MNNVKPNLSRILLLSVVLSTLALSCTQKAVKDQPPNIIFIMADDHANRAISAYDGSINQTPNIDRLAKEGAIFTNSFCGNSICGPSRASILTGLHSHKNGVTGNGAPWNGAQTLFPRLMQQAGYQTALIGKWHLNSNPGDEFDYWKILTGAGRQGFYYNPYFETSDGPGLDMTGYSTDIITSDALQWLEQSRDAEKPFLLLVQYKAPHVPRMPALRHLDKYWNDSIPEPETLFDDFATRSHYATDVNFFIDEFNPWPKAYGTYDPKDNIYLARMTEEERKAYHAIIDPKNEAFLKMKVAGQLDGKKMRSYAYQRFIKDYIRIVDAIDENVGRLLGWLDQDESLKKNTVVIYSADQSYFTGQHGYAEKRLMYEDAMKMPFLIRWPDVIKPGSQIPSLIQNIDYGPTFLDIAGIPVPQEMQGQSFKPLLEGKQADSWRDVVYYHYYDHGRHKVGRHDGIRTERYKLIHFYTDDLWELYDLEADPQELNNLYGQAEYVELVESLKVKLELVRKKYEVPDWVFEPPYVSLKGIEQTERNQ